MPEIPLQFNNEVSFPCAPDLFLFIKNKKMKVNVEKECWVNLNIENERSIEKKD
jgi:hypothetical protein